MTTALITMTSVILIALIILFIYLINDYEGEDKRD
jgi:hypothetical protein